MSYLFSVAGLLLVLGVIIFVHEIGPLPRRQGVRDAGVRVLVRFRQAPGGLQVGRHRLPAVPRPRGRLCQARGRARRPDQRDARRAGRRRRYIGASKPPLLPQPSAVAEVPGVPRRSGDEPRPHLHALHGPLHDRLRRRVDPQRSADRRSRGSRLGRSRSRYRARRPDPRHRRQGSADVGERALQPHAPTRDETQGRNRPGERAQGGPARAADRPQDAGRRHRHRAARPHRGDNTRHARPGGWLQGG